MLRTALTRLLLVVASIVVVVALFEVVGEWRHAGQLYYVDDLDHRMKPDPAYGISSDGIRSEIEADAFREASFRVVFLGDSFVFGHLLPARAAPPQQLEQIIRGRRPDLDAAVANFGWVSSSPFLSLRLLRDIGAKYAPNLVLLGLDMTDIHDDVKYRRIDERYRLLAALDVAPVVTTQVKRGIAAVPALEGVHEALFGFPSRRYFAMRAPLDDTRAWFSFVRESIEEIARFCEQELDAKFVLVVMPRSVQYSEPGTVDHWDREEYEGVGPWAREPFRYFEEMGREVDFDVVSLLPDFQQTDVFPTTLPDDPHWNPAGAHVAARAVFEHCRAIGCFPALAPEPAPAR